MGGDTRTGSIPVTSIKKPCTKVHGFLMLIKKERASKFTRRGKLLIEFVCDSQILVIPIDECTEFQKHLRMAMAYEKRK